MYVTASRLFLSLAGYWQSDKARQAIHFPCRQGLPFTALGDQVVCSQQFTLPAAFLDQRCAFFCESMSAPAYIYLNGVLAHIHYALGEPVEFACNDLVQPGDNQVTIRFVNLPDKDTCPLLPPMNTGSEDWLALATPVGMPAAGIFAEIGIKTTPWSHISGWQLAREEGGILVQLETLGQLDKTYVFLLNAEGEEVYTGEGLTHVLPEDLLESWSTDQPTLYQVEGQAVEKGHLVDHWLMPLGRGVSGKTIPPDQPVFSLDEFFQGQRAPFISAQAGYLRLDGLTEADAYLDLCDQLGQQVILDLPAVTVYAQGVKDVRRRSHLLQKWLRRYSHHPSIQAWGLGRQSGSFPEKAVAHYRGLVKVLDPFHRPLLTDPF